ncbi:hypothetical protein ACNFCJ_07980 [Pseudomonas sp. NY15364]|uniref:hypothetical protein n=1 Tax=Pseudomonas sp. NY15364 TaxID=3400353 RepID=UPI003A8604B4
MTPFYLQTDTEAGMWAALDQLGYVSEHEGERYINVEHSIIGTWYVIDGEDAQALPGWHFNLMLPEVPAEWPAGVTQHNPQTPWRIWR